MAIGARIKQARKLRGWSQRDLAGKLPVSDQTVSKYEREKSLPDSAMLMEIADALEIDLAYFLRAPRVGAIEPVYRKKTSLRVKEHEAFVERIRDWLERYLEVESILSLDHLPFLWPDGAPYLVASMDEVEDAAKRLRRAWDIGLDPIEQITERLEDKALRMESIEAPDAFGACAFQAEINGRVPVIVFNEDRPGDRQRFNVGRELGRLVLEVHADLDEENACNRFGTAFLAPRDAFLRDVGDTRQRVSRRELQLLKQKYGMSMQQLVERMEDLGVLSAYQARRISGRLKTFGRNEFSRNESGHNENESGDVVLKEHPQRFERLVQHALAEELISTRRAAEFLNREVQSVQGPVLV